MTLQPGKLPQHLLAELLARVAHSDGRVLVGPGIGRDAAVIDFGDRLLVAKTDPITFATDHAGWYAVHVNANDIACMGAEPRWLLATALLPPGAPASLPGDIFDQLNAACASLAIELVGGHTEVTLGIDRPIIVGAMLGEASRDAIVLGEGIVDGDAIVLTKGVAIEGTSLLARESAGRLRAAGVAAATIDRAAGMLFQPGISVVPDARAIRGAARPRLMHDPTEGGLATALWEMAAAAGATLRIDPAAIPILDDTREICGALALDPLGLLSSGALLAIVSAGDVAAVTAALGEVKINGRIIGSVERGVPRVIMGLSDPASPMPTFDRDELARFYDDAQG